MDPENKTSDEILEELFSALNVPLSPKTNVITVDDKDVANESDGSDVDDKEGSSKSSASEEYVKEKAGKNHKRKSSKKKKDKKKKKKKHKKKDEDSRHKSKKKHKRDSVIESESESDPKVNVIDTEAENKIRDISFVIQEHLEKSSNGVHAAAEILEFCKSESPKPAKEVLESPKPHDIKEKSDIVLEKGSKELVRKSSVKLNSPERSHSRSESVRSRSRSNSKIRQGNSRSRSRSKHFRYSRSRSRSRSKLNHHSRSTSRTKSLSYKSRTKSPRGLEMHKRRRSRSRSKSLSPKLFKRRRTSRSQSRSFSPKSSRRKYSKSRSKSRSPKPFRRKRSTRSRSLSPLRISSRRRTRSRSGSRKRSHPFQEALSSLSRRLDVSKTHEVLKEQRANIEIDLSSIPTPGNKPECSAVPISLESIPLPVPLSGVPDPSSIPLPQPVTPSDQQDSSKGGGAGIDIGTIPVPVNTVETSTKEQEPAKQADSSSEKGKAKTIIIKSLKDSLIYLQAQEEAERRAKVKEDEDDLAELLEEIEDEKENDENDSKEVEEPEEKICSDSEAVEKVIEEIVELEDKKEVTEEKKNDKEEGELSSEECGDDKTKSHKKKSKKDKNKDKKKAKKEKTKDKEKRKRSRERSRSKDRPNKSKSRSRSKERSKHKRHSSSSWNRDHDSDRRHRRHSRSHSRSRDRFSRHHRRSYSRSRSRSRSRSGRKRDCVTDLRDKVNRKRLLEIARRNAVYLMQNGCLPPSVEQEQLVKIKTGGKSVEELTDFCKQLVASGNYSDVELSDPSLSSDEDKDKDNDKPFTCTRHPFNVRDSKPILMNIRNAPMLPTKTNAERLADHAKLREQFPVSSGSQHRNKGEVTNTEDKHRTESGWVPVSPKEKKPKEEDSVFSKQEAPAVDISQIVSSRLSAMRKLQDNPHDVEALNTLRNVQKEMQSWALSKQEPGQFTGSTGVKILSHEELCAGQQAWVRKEQFKEAAPVRPQFGLKMLQKMGWTPGEGLGKNKEGAIEPLLLDVKMDKKGFHAQEELTPKKQPIPMAKDLAGKHPVSALVEYCSKHKLQPPQFEMVFDYGPDHKKNFLMKVRVNGQEYKPAVAGPTKKLAKANAAAACLQSLGLFPKDLEHPITETPN